MSDVFAESAIRLSLLDRLLDDDPEVSSEAPLNAVQRLRLQYGAVRRDLEDLLNTRTRARGWSPDLNELERSLASYGLPDFSGVNLASHDGREEFRRMIEDTIRRCEPRLKAVSVTLIDDVEPLDRTLHFHIDALLVLEPEPQPIVFDTRLEPATGSFTLEENA